MGGQFQSNSTDLFSTAAAVTRRYGSAAGFTCVYLCSTIRVKVRQMNIGQEDEENRINEEDKTEDHREDGQRR